MGRETARGVDRSPGQTRRLFRPLSHANTFVMLVAALLSIIVVPELRDLLLRAKIDPKESHRVSRFIIWFCKSFVSVAPRWPALAVAIDLLALTSAVQLAPKLCHEFMPPLNEGDMLYTFPM